MANITQIIEIKVSELNKQIVNALKSQKFKRGFAELLLEINLDRIKDGYDVNSRKFGGYNRSYNKKRAMKYTKEKKTNIATTSMSKKLILTGNLLKSISVYSVVVKGTKNGLVLKTGFYLQGSLQNKKAEGLYSTTGYTKSSRYSKKSMRFLGLATGGNYNRTETRLINDYITNYVNSEVLIKIKKR